MARFRAFALAGVEPVEMLTGPIPATRAVLARVGLQTMCEGGGMANALVVELA